MKSLREFVRDEDALTTVEYALLLALMLVVGIVAWRNLGAQVSTTAGQSADVISNASSS